jgi:hypothetical protein
MCEVLFSRWGRLDEEPHRSWAIVLQCEARDSSLRLCGKCSIELTPKAEPNALSGRSIIFTEVTHCGRGGCLTQERPCGILNTYSEGRIQI